MRTRFLVTIVAAIAAAVALAPSALAGSPQTTVDVNPFGAGSGNVAGFAINCSYLGAGLETGACQNSFNDGDVVILTVAPFPGSTFGGWAGSCPGFVYGVGGGACQFEIGFDTFGSYVSVTPRFDIAGRTITVVKGGTGQGTVTSNPPGLSCGGTCSWVFPGNSAVTLTATPSSGSTFAGWGGACAPAGTTPVCTVSTVVAQTVSANFNTSQTTTFTLAVSTGGNGQGTVTSSPTGISCPSICTAAVAAGTTVSLVPNPAPGSVFAGWSGACTGTGSCSVTVNASASVGATFQTSAVLANVVGWRTVKTSFNRVTRVTIAAQQPVRVAVRIVRNGRTLAARTVLNFFPGTRIVNVAIPNSVAKGKARIVIELTNSAGNTKTQRGNVNLPKAP